MKGFLVLCGVLALMACNPTPPLPTPTHEALLTDGNLPKSIITIEINAELLATPTPAQTITPTQALPTLPFINYSPTPYTGVFLGEPTAISAEGQVIIPPTIPAFAFSANAGGSIPPINAPDVSGGLSVGNCNLPVASAFASAYSKLPTLGCPSDAGVQTNLVTQRFERGRMFWRDNRQILVLSDGGTFWRESDTWAEGIPVDDPALVPPSGFLQPVRGFGLLWRNKTTYRETLGWALGPEFSLSSTWQDFEGGTLFIGENQQLYVLPAGGSGQFSTASP